MTAELFVAITDYLSHWCASDRVQNCRVHCILWVIRCVMSNTYVKHNESMLCTRWCIIVAAWERAYDLYRSSESIIRSAGFLSFFEAWSTRNDLVISNNFIEERGRCQNMHKKIVLPLTTCFFTQGNVIFKFQVHNATAQNFTYREGDR